MKLIKSTVYVTMGIMIAGCSTPVSNLGSAFNSDMSVSDLLNYTMVIPNSQINYALAKGFPVSKTTDFGTLMLNRASLGSSRTSEEIMVDVGTKMMMFNTNRGIDADVKVAGGLRYDPMSKQIYLKNLRPVDVKLGNTRLSQYVPQGIIDTAGMIVSQRLGEIPVYKMKDNFTAKFIKSIKVKDGNVAVEYGL